MARQNAASLKFDLKPSEAALRPSFSNFDMCRPDVAGDVISVASEDLVGLDVRAKFDDSRLNGGLIIRLFVRPHPFCTPLCIFN